MPCNEAITSQNVLIRDIILYYMLSLGMKVCFSARCELFQKPSKTLAHTLIKNTLTKTDPKFNSSTRPKIIVFPDLRLVLFQSSLGKLRVLGCTVGLSFTHLIYILYLQERTNREYMTALKITHQLALSWQSSPQTLFQWRSFYVLWVFPLDDPWSIHLLSGLWPVRHTHLIHM